MDPTIPPRLAPPCVPERYGRHKAGHDEKAWVKSGGNRFS